MSSRMVAWVFWLYLMAATLDLAWHFYVFRTTGDRAVAPDELIEAVQASLFWPVDLAAQLLLALSHATPQRR